jgi:hypothetical protein
MSSLEHLPKPVSDTRRKVRKRSAPGPSFDHIIVPPSQQQPETKDHQNLPPTAMAPPSTTASIPTPMQAKPQAIQSQSDVIDRFLYNVESRMVQQSSVFETAIEITNTSSRRAMIHEHGHGKLTADELDRLSLLSAAAISARESSQRMNRNGNSNAGSDGDGDGGCIDASATNENDFSWFNVDIDSVTQLSGYLEEHIKSAMFIDLIQEARIAFGDNEIMVSDLNGRLALIVAALIFDSLN